MSFLRSLCDSLTRSKESPPVLQSQQQGSSNNKNSSNVLAPVGGLKRGDTFILSSGRAEDDGNTSTETVTINNTQNNLVRTSSHTTLNKKSKKSNMFSKFKLKKSTSLNKTSSSDTEICNDVNGSQQIPQGCQKQTPDDHESQSDPFHFLYEKRPSLKALRKEISKTERNDSGRTSITSFYSINSRKSLKDDKASLPPSDVKNVAEVADTETEKTPTPMKTSDAEAEAEKAQKYGTVTLHSFRKSFRDQMLRQLKEAPHNPAWFVEVEKNAVTATNDKTTTTPTIDQNSTKEGRRDLLIFENENYKPLVQSPISERKTRNLRFQTKCSSNLTRNHTFRIERSASALIGSARPIITTPIKKEPTIHFEIKNSIMPNTPRRVVPVGVAKPMPSLASPSQRSNTPIRPSRSPVRNSGGCVRTSNPRTTSLQTKTALSSKFKPVSATPEVVSKNGVKNSNATNCRQCYQTLIKFAPHPNAMKTNREASESLVSYRTSIPIRIQLEDNNLKNVTNNCNNRGRRYNNTSGMMPILTQRHNHYNVMNSSQKPTSILKVPLCSPAFAKNQKSSRIYFNGSQSERATKPNLVNESKSKINGNDSSVSGRSANKHHSRFTSLTNRQTVARDQPTQSYQRSLSVAQIQRRSRSPKKIPWR